MGHSGFCFLNHFLTPFRVNALLRCCRAPRPYCCDEKLTKLTMNQTTMTQIPLLWLICLPTMAYSQLNRSEAWPPLSTLQQMLKTTSLCHMLLMTLLALLPPAHWASFHP